MRVMVTLLALYLSTASLLTSCATTSTKVASEATPEAATPPPAVVEAELAHEANPKVDLDSNQDTEIPKEVNDHVLKWVDYFSGKGRKHMQRYLERSARYAPTMKEILKQNGLPEDLIYLALIESGFSSGARSHASAVGFWQFIRGTAKTYNLKVSPLVDERRDFARSTEAAAAYLKGLYNLFGNWYLAIASYNVGENRVKRVVMDEATRDFWELARSRRLPRETVDYVPKFIAARMIAKNPEKFGFQDLDYAEPLVFESIQVDRPISLRLLAQNAGVEIQDLRDLNPSFRTEYVPVDQLGGSISIRIPPGKVESAMAALENAYVNSRQVVAKFEESEGIKRHKVKSGDTLRSIARRYGVAIGALRDYNELDRRSTLRVGGFVRIPTREVAFVKSRSKRSRGKSTKSTRIAGQTNVAAGVYVVRRGDTLVAIARKHNVSIQDLASMNNLKSEKRLFVGRRLVIPD